MCRAYEPDRTCDLVAAPTLEGRVQRYLALFGLEAEAAVVRASGATSMRAVRRLAVVGRSGR